MKWPLVWRERLEAVTAELGWERTQRDAELRQWREGMSYVTQTRDAEGMARRAAHQRSEMAIADQIEARRLLDLSAAHVGKLVAERDEDRRILDISQTALREALEGRGAQEAELQSLHMAVVAADKRAEAISERYHDLVKSVMAPRPVLVEQPKEEPEYKRARQAISDESVERFTEHLVQQGMDPGAAKEHARELMSKVDGVNEGDSPFVGAEG